MIIDSHAHVILPTENQILMMEEAGVDKTILFSTTPHPEKANDLAGFEKEIKLLFNILSGKCTLEERMRNIRHAASELYDTIQKHPDKFLGFGLVPLSLSYEETCEWMEKNIIANGFSGIGEFTFGTGNVGLLETVFKALLEFRAMPVWIHTFHPLTLADIKDIAALTAKFSGIPVILGHMGGVNWLDTIKIAREQKNLYLDLSAVFTTIAPRLAISELPDRTLFSSDAPYGNPLLARKMVEVISPNDKVTEMVLGGNIMGLLNMSQ
ncbi:MAG TPA: amidohydrolase family protein [Methylomusa anaerophila]|uniref:Amidohydrolase n=1 Tax=Methylomusa anaerophila TaxID=1930071 RepID=A0A348AF19_9FIRM|nr:amidohydrolase family protein [Methylomusa anaerophila]BBB89667.1 amidohydrolase [Methylomusa anaerophila]HML89556.1 amidohydrolase family protein [Methylomusa anaerophila]